MPFADAIRSVLSRYTEFSGRSRRSEYWWWTLASLLANLVAKVLDSVVGISLFQVLLFLAVVVPGLAVTFRRLHDTNHSAWWLFIGLVPIAGLIVLLVFFCSDSKPESNRWGASPKGGDALAPTYG